MRKCFGCGVEHDGSTSPKHRWMYCTDSCFLNARILKEEQRVTIEAARKQKREARRLTCARVGCGVVFQPTSPLQKFCCRPCGWKGPPINKSTKAEFSYINRPVKKTDEGVRTYLYEPRKIQEVQQTNKRTNQVRAEEEAARFLKEMNDDG